MGSERDVGGEVGRGQHDGEERAKVRCCSKVALCVASRFRGGGLGQEDSPGAVHLVESADRLGLEGATSCAGEDWPVNAASCRDGEAYCATCDGKRGSRQTVQESSRDVDEGVTKEEEQGGGK